MKMKNSKNDNYENQKTVSTSNQRWAHESCYKYSTHNFIRLSYWLARRILFDGRKNLCVRAAYIQIEIWGNSKCLITLAFALPQKRPFSS